MKKPKKVKKPLNIKTLKRIALALIIVLIAGLLYTLVAGYTNEAKNKVKLQNAIQSINAKEQQLKLKDGTIQEKAKQLEELQKQKSDLEQQLQAKKEAARVLAEAQASKPQVSGATAVRVAVNGSCADWLAQAGVADVNSAMILINKESGCNPNAVNSSSGACGVAQELPCGKSGCAMGDGACQVRWMSSYVQQRYGSWANALSFHYSHNWY